MEHHAALCAVGLDDELWRWIPTPVRTPEDMRAYMELAFRAQAEGSALPFTTIDLASGQVAGCTRFAAIERAHRRLEIGWTWIGRAWQRTAVNTEAKYLMLRHAFETLGAHRVELKTDSLNQQSRRAILRLGAVEEGTFRKHMITHAGRIRHTVYFSILDDEWPAVKARLGNLLGAPQ